MQSWSLERKIQVTQTRILEFCIKTNWNVSVSFSGGVDSTVLLDLVCLIWKTNSHLHNRKRLLVIYANTSNEFASMPKHVESVIKWMGKEHGVDIELQIVRGDQTYVDVVKTVGYPIGSKKIARMVRDVRSFLKERYGSVNAYEKFEKNIDNGIESADQLRALGFPATIVLRLTGITSENHKCTSWKIPKKWRKLIIAPFEVSEQCCDILKKAPMKAVQKASNANPIFGTLAEDSEMRRESYMKTGCNAFNDNGVSHSTPMGFWLRQNNLQYTAIRNLPIAPPYGELILLDNGQYEFTGEHNTGCKLCLFGCHLEKCPNRIQRLEKIEPATYKFAMMPLSDGGLGYREVMKYCGMPC